MSDKKSLAMIGDDLDALLDTRDGCDDPELRKEIDAAIEASTKQLDKKIDSYYYVLSKWKSEAERFDKEADKLYSKAKSYLSRIDWLESIVYQFLKDHNQTEIDGETQGFRIAKNPPKLNITNAKLIPSMYIDVVPAKMEVRNAELKADLMRNVIVPGAELTQGEHLRTK